MTPEERAREILRDHLFPWDDDALVAAIAAAIDSAVAAERARIKTIVEADGSPYVYVPDLLAALGAVRAGENPPR